MGWGAVVHPQRGPGVGPNSFNMRKYGFGHVKVREQLASCKYWVEVR